MSAAAEGETLTDPGGELEATFLQSSGWSQLASPPRR